MKYLVLGAGRQGTAIAQDLLETAADTTGITVVDSDAVAVRRLEEKLGDARLTIRETDIRNEAALETIMIEADVAIGATASWLHYPAASLAVRTGTHFLDMGVSGSGLARVFELDDPARQQNVTVVPGCGLAPGLVGILGYYLVEGMGPTESLKLRAGGLPLQPGPPMNYQASLPIPELIQEYLDPATVVRNGMLRTVPALSELEILRFPAPFGELEAFPTGGGIGTLPRTLAGRVPHVDFKTVRYKGHCHQVRLLCELGLTEATPLEFPGGKLSPREMLVKTMASAFGPPVEDVVLLLAVAEGWDTEGKPVRRSIRIVCHHDPVRGLSAMSRVAGFTAAIIAHRLASGQAEDPGVRPPEQVIPGDTMIRELERRGMQIESWSDQPGDPA